MPPELALSPVQISLIEIIKALDVQGRSKGFSLSSAIVPTIDIHPFLEASVGIDRSQTYDASPGPHAQTERFSYTVPSSTRALLQLASGSAIRSAAGGVVGTVQLNVNISRAGSVRNLVRAQYINNTVGAQDAQRTSHLIYLLPGDRVFADTVDLSTTTSINFFRIDALIVELPGGS